MAPPARVSANATTWLCQREQEVTEMVVSVEGGSTGSSGPSGTVSVTRGMVSDGGSSAGGLTVCAGHHI